MQIHFVRDAVRWATLWRMKNQKTKPQTKAQTVTFIGVPSPFTGKYAEPKKGITRPIFMGGVPTHD